MYGLYKNKTVSNVDFHSEKLHLAGSKMKDMSKQIITTAKAPKPIGPYNQAIIAGGFLFHQWAGCH